MKRPAFQFYPADWRKDVELQSCSMAAQGLWINAMCVAHECEPYGHLAVNGKAMNAAQIGRQVGLNARETQALLNELLEAGAARMTPEGMIFSKRMVADERLRNVRADAGRLGGNPLLLAKKVKQTDKQNTTPSSSSSSSTSVQEKAPTELPASSLRSDPAPPPPFDGKNAQALNGKSVVALSPQWELPEAWGVDAEALGWEPREVLFEAEKFRQYWTAGKGTGTRRAVKSWRQTWSNWLGKAAERKIR